MDWNDLASSALPSLSDNNNISGSGPHGWNLNLSQLQVAGQSLLHGSSGISMGDPFGNSRFAVAGEAQQGISGSRSDPFATAPGAMLQQATHNHHHRPLESLEDAIQRHEEEMLSSIIQRCTDETRQSTAAAIEAQLQAAWEADRAVWVKELVGTGSLGGAAATVSAASSNTKSNIVGLLAASPFRSSAGPNQNQRFQPPGAAVFDTAKPDPALVQAHWKVVQQMRQERIADVIDNFARVADATAGPQNHRNSSAILGYASAWQLAGNLVLVPHSPVDQAKATLAHFCKQFQVVVTNRVRQAALAGQDTSSAYTHDLAAQCETFTRLTVGAVDPWAVLYYCLRCGDAVAAMEVLRQISTDPALQRIVDVMAQAQGNAACMWESRNSLFRLDPSDRRVVGDLLEHTKRTDPVSNIHQMGVYSLFSASSSQPVTSETIDGFKTIEDYLTGSLWKAVLQPNPVDELIGLGELILSFGPSHFEDPSSGGWSFALPLLASQQYQKALAWLSEAGGPMGLLQAVHLGLVLFEAGITVRNLGHNDSAADGTLASLLVAYATELLVEPGSLAALDYLVHIPNEVRARKEVAELIVLTRDIDKLVGTVNAEGMRQGGAIAAHFTAEELSSILIEAADLLSATKNDQQKTGVALMCLMLAHRYGDVLSMLNELISPANKSDEYRQFWLEQVTMFHKQYLDKRTHVLEILEREGKTALIRTSRMLVDLNLFFDRLRHGRLDGECWNIAEKLQLLPKSESDRKVKESAYRELDPLIKDIYPSLLVAAMEILNADHRRLKRELHGDASGVVRERVKELQETSRLYTSFAASVGMANEQIGILTQLSSLMI